jgi:PAS domain S-box-containing protein
MTTETKRKDRPEGLAGDKYFNLIEHAADGIAIIQDGVFKLVNTALTHISGYDKEELLGMPFTELLTPASQKLTIERYQARLVGKKVPQTYEIQAVTKDGQIRDIELNAALTEYDGHNADEVIIRDITDRKQAEAAIQRAEQEKTAILNSMSEIVIFQDLEHHMLWVNKIASESAGLTHEQMMGRHCYEVWSQRNKPCIGCPVEKACQTGKPQKAEIATPDGRVWSIRGYPTLDENGVITGMLEVALDLTERKKAEQALADEATRRRILIDQSRDGIVILDQNGKVYEANQQFAEMLGYTPEETAQLHVWDWEYLFPRDRVLEMIRTVDEAGDHFETCHRRKDGSVYDVEISTNGTMFAGQKLIFCVCRNITERRQAEDALRESEDRYRTVIEGAHDMIQSVALDGSINFVNQAWLDALGYTKADLPKLNLVKVIHPASLPHCREMFERVIKGEPANNVQATFLTRDGREILVEGNAAPRYIGDKVVATQGIFRDITERKNMEKQLQEKNEELDAQNEELKAINEELQATEEELQHSQERLERMFESATDGIVVTTLDGTVLKVNERAAQMIGYTSEDELLGKSCFDCVAPGDHQKMAKNMQKVIKEGLIKRQEYTLRKADGTEFPAELSTNIIKDASGNAIGLITIARDITERRQAEEREDQLQQELNLASRLASIGQLAAGVAHEINNPLTGVIGFSHLMLSRDIPDDMKQDLQVIHSEAQRVAKIVENLLVFAHQRKTGREYVNINDIITRVLELRAYEMKVNNIEVEKQLDPELPLTVADAGQFQQVFLNIVLNAEYFMTKANNKGQLVVKTEKTNGNIRISFTDDGTGIIPENLDKIFNPFFTTKEVGKGTGLGLSICHGIITQHQGRIYAQSQPGKGATFVIELPIVAEPVQAGKAKVTKKEPQKPRMAKILVVDDEKAILTFLSRLLTEWGHSVETINNADTALEKLRAERYSLVLLDIKLPGMSGIELYHHIEEIAPALARRVMFITGDIMEGATRSFLEKTGAPYITKPLDIEVLKKTINSVLGEGAQRLTA